MIGSTGRFVAVALTAVLAAASWAFAQAGPDEAGSVADAPPKAAAPVSPEDDWIRPEDVVDRADSLARRLEFHTVTDEVESAIADIETQLSALGPTLDAGFQQSEAALSGHASLLTIQDARRELSGPTEKFSAWKEKLEAEARRVGAVLEEAEAARMRWTRTLARPETAQAGEVVQRRVQSSLEQIARLVDELKTWRTRVLALNDRLLDRTTAVEAILERLEKATLTQSASLLVPDHAPIWRRGFETRLAHELPLAGKQLGEFRRSTSEYVAADARPFVMQLLLWLALMLAMRGLPAGSKRRAETSEHARESLRLLQRPYAIATLFALMASQHLHPTAPHRVMQLLVMAAVIPIARILMLANRRTFLPLYVALLGLLVIDRTAIALASLPVVTQVLFLAELGAALTVGFVYRRRLVADGGNPWVVRGLTAAMVGVVLALFAEMGGWTALAALVGRGILVSATGALFIYAAMISIEALCAYALASPALRSSRFVDRNQAMVQRWTSVALHAAAFLYWLRLLVTSLGLRDVGGEALARLMSAGLEVGTLSLSIGGTLAFVSTLVVAFVLSRLVHEVLEDEVFPRTTLPRGIPHALMALTRYAIWSLGFLLALAAAGVQMSQLAILLGGLGVGIGLGLQDVVKNFAAGITLLLERRLHVGDAVQIPDKSVFGRILAIGMRASVVRNWNGAEVVLPNDDLVSGTVTNWTLSDANFRVEVPVGVAYGADPEKVIELLLRVASSDPHLLRQPPPSAFFLGFGDSSLNFVVRGWCNDDYETATARTSALGLAVHRALAEAGIEIPFPQRDVNLVHVSPAASAALRAKETGHAG